MQGRVMHLGRLMQPRIIWGQTMSIPEAGRTGAAGAIPDSPLRSAPERPRRSAAAGFTLVELMVTIAILAVLVAAAAPSFMETIRTTRLQTQSNALFTALMLARSEAVKRNYRVVVCRSADGSSCAGAGGWEQGWLVYPDKDGDNTLDADEPVIRAYGALTGNNTLRTGVNYANRVTFRPDATVTQFDTFRLCVPDAVDDQARRVVVSGSGRPRVEKVADATAICP